MRGRLSHDHMVIRLTTTFAISAYHHYSCTFAISAYHH